MTHRERECSSKLPNPQNETGAPSMHQLTDKMKAWCQTLHRLASAQLSAQPCFTTSINAVQPRMKESWRVGSIQERSCNQLQVDGVFEHPKGDGSFRVSIHLRIGMASATDSLEPLFIILHLRFQGLRFSITHIQNREGCMKKLIKVLEQWRWANPATRYHFEIIIQSQNNGNESIFPHYISFRFQFHFLYKIERFIHTKKRSFLYDSRMEYYFFLIRVMTSLINTHFPPYAINACLDVLDKVEQYSLVYKLKS